MTIVGVASFKNVCVTSYKGTQYQMRLVMLTALAICYELLTQLRFVKHLHRQDSIHLKVISNKSYCDNTCT